MARTFCLDNFKGKFTNKIQTVFSRFLPGVVGRGVKFITLFWKLCIKTCVPQVKIIKFVPVWEIFQIVFVRHITWHALTVSMPKWTICMNRLYFIINSGAPRPWGQQIGFRFKSRWGQRIINLFFSFGVSGLIIYSHVLRYCVEQQPGEEKK